ncbi:MAG: hypothetical protein CL840_02130 [Crocinitomicaceae bacterium]|nr:hypothetical protein [Crocinitomicaceae bacterium]|tara:strand:+ start:1266 stop:3245 length:1980 start_codon:yes stop_codon:yes gene_type:complete
MKNLFIAIIALVFSPILSAQEDYSPYHEKIEFEKEPKNENLTESDTSSYGIHLIDRTVVDMYYDQERKGGLMEYRTYHKKIKLTTNRSIKQNNKVYFNLNNAVDLVEAKARVIKSDNSIINLNPDDIKEAENFEEYGRFKYFAFEGIELGADIEYIYTIKRNPDYNGNRFLLQGEAERNNVEFILIAPSNLYFDFVSLNGFPEVIRDTNDTTVNFYSAQVDKMSRLESEDYSSYTTSRQGVMYKLDYNGASGSKNLVSYTQAAQNIHVNMHYNVSSADLKSLSSLSKKLKISKMDTEDKLRHMEKFIKSNLNSVDQSGEDLESISKILENKNCNNSGLMKVYVNWIENEGIEYELCLGTERDEFPFEKDFEIYNCLGDYFFYFPEIDKYMVPDYWGYRLGYLPPSYTENYALFMKEVTLGDFTTYMSRVKWVKPSSKDITYTNLDMNVDLGDSFDKTEVSFVKTAAGHEAAIFQASYESLSQEQLKNLEPVFLAFFNDEEKVITQSFENTNPLDVFQKPFVINATLDYPNLVQKAGPKYLVSVGKIIGPQSELYQEKKRELDIELDYNHGYLRDIDVQIPEGYRITNLKDLVFDKSVEIDGEKKMIFTSNYKLEGNTLKISVNEYYDALHLPKSRYDEFKSVINAAADFNKVVLVFEKG